MCSSLLGKLFGRVRFPILPQMDGPCAGDAPGTGPTTLLRRIFGYESEAYTGLFRMRHPTLLTPRDFDLSPYFETIKFNVVADGRFDYQRIQWVELEGEPGDHPRPYGALPAPRAADPR
jgi:hypothetical protein